MKVLSPSLLALFVSRVCASSVVESHYKVIRRSEAPRDLIDEEDIDTLGISFDGNVTAIQELAMQKALGEIPSSSFSCPDAEIALFELLTWEYSIEYESTADPAAIIAELELALRGALAPRLLSCQNDAVEDKAIVAVDADPVDLPDDSGK